MSEIKEENQQKCNKCEVLQAKLIDAEASWARQRETLKQVSQNLETQIGSIQSQKESLAAQLEAEQLRGQGLETKISEANAKIAELQREMICQKSSIKNEFEKMIEEQHKLSALNTSLTIKNQSLELKVQNSDQMLEAVRLQLQNQDQQKEQISTSRLEAEKKNQEQAAKIENNSRQVEQLIANIQRLESEKQRHTNQSSTQISSLKQDLAYEKQQVESQMSKNTQLELQVSQMLAERRSHFTSQSSAQEKVRQMELNEQEFKKLIKEKESENERNQTHLSALKKQMLESKKQIGQFALGKLDFSDVSLNEPQLTEIIDRHEELKSAVMANGQLQETMKGATSAISRLQQQYRECTAKNMKLKQQCLTLQSESSSDRALVASLNKVLLVRQEEFMDANNKLKQLQNALKDSTHVQEIQETIRNNSENYQTLTKNDKDLVVKADDLKKELFHDQKLSQMVKTENSNLKLQLAELTEQTSKEKLKGNKESEIPIVAQDGSVKQADMRDLIQTIENNHHDALVKKTQEIATIRSQLQEASARLVLKDNEESKAQSPEKSTDISIVQQYEQVINSKTQEINSLQLQLQNSQDTFQLVKQQLDNQTSHVEFCKKQTNELQDKLAEQIREKAELRNEKTQWLQKEQELQAGFLDQTEKQRSSIDNLTFINSKLTEDGRIKDGDLFRLKISSENLSQVKLQLEKQLSIKQAQIDELTIDRKNYVFKNVVDIEIEKVFDAENKIKSLEQINDQHEKDHQSEIQKREGVMKQVQQLFGDVESKLAQREAEIEAKNSGQIKRQTAQIKKLNEQLSESKEKILELQDENKSLKEQVEVIEEQKDKNDEIKNAVANQNSVDEQLAVQKLRLQHMEAEYRLKEAILEREKISQQLQQEQKVLYETRKSLSDQIETLNEKNKLLEKTLEEEKKSAVLGRQTEGDARNADTEQKLNAAETEAEKQKGEKMLLQAVLEQTQQQKTASDFKLSQANLELERAKTMLDLNKVLVEQLQQLNTENKQIKADNEAMKGNLDQAQKQVNEKQDIINTRLSKPEAQQAILDTKAALFALNQAYTELKASQLTTSLDAQNGPPPNQVLQAMHQALRRGKQLFLLLQSQLENQNQEPKIEVGQKRPRTSE